MAAWWPSSRSAPTAAAFSAQPAHPFENPTPWSNLIEISEITLLPMASLVMLGLMLKNRAHAAVIYGSMLAFLVVGVAIAVYYEAKPSPADRELAGRAEPEHGGQGGALGAIPSAAWAAMTTATSNGSVNSMHDSLNPIAGMVAMSNLMLNVVFSGVGTGFLNMLMYVVVAVFLAGLMVGRTPEYLGKKIESKEVKLAMMAILLHPLLILAFAGLFSATDMGAKTTGQSRPARLLRDPLRVQFRLCQQRFRFRGPG